MLKESSFVSILIPHKKCDMRFFFFFLESTQETKWWLQNYPVISAHSLSTYVSISLFIYFLSTNIPSLSLFTSYLPSLSPFIYPSLLSFFHLFRFTTVPPFRYSVDANVRPTFLHAWQVPRVNYRPWHQFSESRLFSPFSRPPNDVVRLLPRAESCVTFLRDSRSITEGFCFGLVGAATRDAALLFLGRRGCQDVVWVFFSSFCLFLLFLMCYKTVHYISKQIIFFSDSKLRIYIRLSPYVQFIN